MISKIFANSRPSASNFKSFSQSLEQFLLTVGQNNFGNKIPLLLNKSFCEFFFQEFRYFHTVHSRCLCTHTFEISIWLRKRCILTHFDASRLRGRSLTALTKFCPLLTTYSVIHISIPPIKELCSKKAPGEVNVSLP